MFHSKYRKMPQPQRDPGEFFERKPNKKEKNRELGKGDRGHSTIPDDNRRNSEKKKGAVEKDREVRRQTDGKGWNNLLQRKNLASPRLNVRENEGKSFLVENTGLLKGESEKGGWGARPSLGGKCPKGEGKGE